ncbi:MAG: hypothetical protein IPH55_13660 [Betaproteobacteria bacterium]|nr:hypothetical protein [Betaproteobacteria bacterium]
MSIDQTFPARHPPSQSAGVSARCRGAYRGDPATESVYASWAHALAQNESRVDPPIYLASCTGGAALHRAAAPVLIGRSAPAAAAVLADDLARDRRAVPGVIGSRAGCLAFARRWRRHSGCAHRWRMRLRQHGLTSVAAVPVPPGAMRVAAAADVPWIIGAQLAFRAEAGMSERPSEVAAVVPGRVAGGEIRVWEDGDVVAYGLHRRRRGRRAHRSRLHRARREAELRRGAGRRARARTARLRPPCAVPDRRRRQSHGEFALRPGRLRARVQQEHFDFVAEPDADAAPD